MQYTGIKMDVLIHSEHKKHKSDHVIFERIRRFYYLKDMQIYLCLRIVESNLK